MNHRRCLFASVLPFALLLSGCEFAIEGDGQITEVRRSVAAFTEVESDSSLDVEIRQGHVFEVAVRVDRNLISRVTTRVQGGRLVIDTDGPLEAHGRGPQVVVTMPVLARAVLDGSGELTIDSWEGEGPIFLVLSGSGDLAFDGDAPAVTAELEGSGDAHLRGRAEAVDLRVGGSGDLDARELASSRATLRVSGSGDLAANVDGLVDVSLTGSGDVDLFGRPRIHREVTSGSGDVKLHR